MKTIKKTMLIVSALLIVACSNDDASTTTVVKSNAKQMTAFTFRAADNASLDADVMATINEAAKTIDAVLPVGTNLNALKPEIEISASATSNLVGAQDFSNPVSYTITAEDGSSNVYSVLVDLEKSTEKQILSLVFNAIDNAALNSDISAEIDEENKTITATVPNNTNVTDLMPVIEVSTDAEVSPDGQDDFTNPLTYTVTAEDGSTVEYSVTVIIAKSDENQLLAMAFRLLDLTNGITQYSVSINEGQKTGVATLPSGTDITNLLATRIEISPEATISPDGRQDFSNPVKFTVTAENGDETDYEISIVFELPKILEFKFLTVENSAIAIDITAEIDSDTNSILAIVPDNTSIGNLVPSFTISPGATISPIGAQDFNQTQLYTVTAQDGSSRSYAVQVELN